MAYPLATRPYQPNWTIYEEPAREKLSLRGYQPPPVDPKTGAYVRPGAPAAAPAPVPATTPAAPPATTQPQGRAYRAGQALRGAAGTLGNVGKAAGAAGLVTSLGDYRIDDPSVDSSAGGTLRALGSGDFAGAGRSLSKGALEAGMSLGSFGAKTAGLVAPEVPAAYDRMLRSQFGSQLIGPNDTPTAPAAPSLRAPISTPTLFSPSMAGPGRGSADHPLRLDMDPGRASLGAARDFSRELGAVPRDLPSDLRSGVVFKTQDANGRTVYSGRDVRAGAQMVDGLGRRTGELGGLTSTNGSAGMQADLAELGRLRSANALREGAFAANQPGGGFGGFSTRNEFDDLRARSGMSSMDRELRAMSPRQRAETLRQQAMLAQRSTEAAAGNAVALRGQDVGAFTTQRGQDVGASTAMRGQDVALRGQDMDYAEKIDARRLDIAAKNALRQGATWAWQQGKGDPGKAAAAAASLGLDPSNFLSLAREGRDASAASDKALDRALASVSVGPDGKISEGQLALNRTAAKKAMNGLEQLTPEEHARLEPTTTAVGSLRSNFSGLRGGGLMQRLGVDSPPPEMSELPDLRGYSLRRLGMLANIDPTHGAHKGDYEFTAPGRPTLRLDHSKIGTYELDLLRRRGAMLPE